MSSSTEHTPEPQSSMIDQNIETVLAMQRAEARALSRHQRSIERMVSLVAVPAFLFAVLAAIILWVGINLFMMSSGSKPWDPPPFGLLQTIVSIIAIVMTLIVLITQNRQGKAAEVNAQIDLQINLLIDQKAAKIIQLLEEMRVDSPTLRNRVDTDAEELQQAVDPQQVAAALAEKMATFDDETDIEKVESADDEILEKRTVSHTKE